MITVVESAAVSGVSTVIMTYSHATKRLSYDYTGLGNTRRLGMCHFDYFDPETVHCKSWRRHQGTVKYCFRGLFKLIRLDY